jgi:hypothetical protein
VELHRLEDSARDKRNRVGCSVCNGLLSDDHMRREPPANRRLPVGGPSVRRFIVQLVDVFGGLCRGVGFHPADYNVTDERKEQQLDV